MLELNPEVFDTLIEDGTVVVDFYSNGCSPCVRMMKILPTLEEKLRNIAEMYKVNADEQTALAEKYDVDSVPTFIFFNNGKEVERFSGVKTLAEIEQITLKVKENGYGEERTTQGQ